jgi:hypothetical protein
MLVDDPTLRNERRAIALVERKVFVARVEPVSETRRVPGQFAQMCARVGIEQQLIGIETMPVLWVVWAVDPIAVQPARSDTGEIPVMDFVGVLGQRDPLDFMRSRFIE